MTSNGTYIRSTLSAVLLCCYVISICQVPLLEGIHFLSHLVSGDHSSTGIHSFHSHEGQHNHDELDIINSLADQQSDQQKSHSQTDTDKKYQIATIPISLVGFSIAMIDYETDYETNFHSLKLPITTPPPQI